MNHSTFALSLLGLVACASPQTPRANAPAPRHAESPPVSELASEPAASLHTHGFQRFWALPRGFANPTRSSSAEYTREDRGVSVVILEGVPFAVRHFSQEPRSEQRPMTIERAQRYFDAVAEAHRGLQQDSLSLDGPSRNFTRSLSVEGPECLVPESQGECTYYGLSIRPPDMPTSDDERAYLEAWNTIIDLTSSLVDEVFPVTS